MNTDRINNDFTYHPPKEGQPELYHAIREEARNLAHFIDQLVLDGREKSLALTKLEEAVFWANAGVARNG